jgi:hypothetical protein
MKEIHAYRNEDGTYRVTCIGEVKETKELQDHSVVKENTQATMEIQRAKLHIEALVANDKGQIMTVVIGE